MTGAKVVIIGAGGRLGVELTRAWGRHFQLTAFNHQQLDLANANEICSKLGNLDFDALINSAAFTNVDLSESKRDEAFAVNADAPKLLAQICTQKNARLIHISTDYVFDGEKREPYAEDDAALPISAYGESKLRGEENVLAAGRNHLVLRVSWVFGPDRPSFIDAMIKRAREEDHVEAIADKFSTPTYTEDIAHAALILLFNQKATGVLHFANAGQCTWQEYAQHALDCCAKAGFSLKAKTVASLKLADMKDWVACRPVYSVLSTAKYQALTGVAPRSWRDAVADYIERSYSKK